MNQPVNLSGKKFSRLLVVSLIVKTKKGEITKFSCLCDCGNTVVVAASKLVSGHTKSCGCYKLEISTAKIIKVATSHGLSRHPLYYIWQGINARCYNPAYQSYHLYGAKGIKVCSTWRNSFMAFYQWALTNGWEKGLHIDRFPNNKGNYKPSNCRIVTGKENSNNRTNTTYVTWNGVTKCSSEWSEITGVRSTIISKRVKDGLSGETAIFGKTYLNRKCISEEKKRVLDLKNYNRKKRSEKNKIL